MAFKHHSSIWESSAPMMALIVPSPQTTVVQEVHLVVVHLLCAAIDTAVATKAQRTIRLDSEISLAPKVSA